MLTLGGGCLCSIARRNTGNIEPSDCFSARAAKMTAARLGREAKAKPIDRVDSMVSHRLDVPDAAAVFHSR